MYHVVKLTSTILTIFLRCWAAADFYGQFNHSWSAPWAMAVELTALKMYWAYSLSGMHNLAMRQVIDGADALVSITSGPTKVQVNTINEAG